MAEYLKGEVWNTVDSRPDVLELSKALPEFDSHPATEQIKNKILWDNAVAFG